MQSSIPVLAIAFGLMMAMSFLGQIDGVICHCTAFNPVPSMSAAVVNHFKMRYDILSYNLAGMGCAASIIAVDLAKELIWVSEALCAIRSCFSLLREATCGIYIQD